MTNPLLQPSTLKNGALALNEIRPEHFPAALDAAIETGKKRLAEVRSKPASFDHTIRGLEACTEELESVYSVFTNLLSAETNEELQKLSLELGPKIASFANDILLDSEVYAHVAEVFQKRKSLALNAEQLQLVEKIHRDFQRSGAGLSDKDKDRMRRIDERLAQLQPKFQENALKSVNEFELWVENEDELKGLSASLKQTFRQAAIEKGQPAKWLVTLQYPSYFPFMKFAENRALREQLYRAMGSRSLGGPFDNREIALEIVNLRGEKARILGFKNFADYALQLRMAETVDQVMQFLDRLLQAAKPAAQNEIREVEELAKSSGAPMPLQAWDFSFWAERLKEKKYAFDEEALRPYFKLENVLSGVFENARRLFGLTFEQSDEYPVYHPDVRVFEVYKDTPERAFIGLFYADFFPRAGKSQGAWMTNFREQGTFRGKLVRPHVSIVCNFTKPTESEPSLLTFSEVTTLFHEFGHALHSLLSQVEFRSLAGTSVFLDFVELPSQIMENWAKEDESLAQFARHYQTGEILPARLMESLKRSQKYLAGYLTMRQLSFAYLDMAWHTQAVSKGQDMIAFERAAIAKTQMLPPVDGTSLSSSFGHIFTGMYAAGYYSYKWAEALDADAFEYFRERGIYNEQVAAHFEEFILSKGGSDHPMRLYEQFRGRLPDPEALLRRDGLV